MNYVIFPILQVQENTPEIICKFKIRLDYVIDIYDYEIEFNKEICPQLPEDAPRHKEFKAIKKIRNDLNKSLILKKDREFDNPKYILVFVSPLIFKKKFESVFCSKCSAENKAKDVLIQAWSEGRWRGREVICKNGHPLLIRWQP